MKMSGLGTRSGLPVATIKYYLREGLLAAGVPTSANQADYSDEHVTRLKLIRALIEVGGLPVATARGVLGAVDDPDLPLSYVFGIAQRAMSDAALHQSIAEPSESSSTVAQVIDRMGWSVSPNNPGINGAARVLDAYVASGHPELAQIWDGYAQAADLVARADLDSVARRAQETGGDVTELAETVVVGTILGDALFASLRRLAQEHVSHQTFPPPAQTETVRPGSRSKP